jgi:hypothetical protein
MPIPALQIQGGEPLGFCQCPECCQSGDVGMSPSVSSSPRRNEFLVLFPDENDGGKPGAA